MGRMTVTLLLALVLVSGAAMAAPVTVDFSAPTGMTYSITLPETYTLDGVTFSYDNLGAEADFAAVDELGIYGTPTGLLIFDFAAPATSLNLDFSLLGSSSAPPDAMFIALTNGGADVTSALIPADGFVPYDPNDLSFGGDAYGTYSYSGAAFDRAFMFYSIDSQIFSVDALSYEPANANVPEPSGIAFLAAGLLGVPGLRLARRRS